MVGRNILTTIFLSAVSYLALGTQNAAAKEFSVVGRTYTTTVGELPPFHRVSLRNPCGANRLILPNVRERRNNKDFVELMMNEVNRAIVILAKIQEADPDVGACIGLGPLKTLPAIPPPNPISKDQLLAQMYQIGINLATHLRVMSLDRQMIVNSTGINQFGPTIRCGSESENLVELFYKLTQTFDDILCVAMAEASPEVLQNSFTPAYNDLMVLPMLRFEKICSSMEVRDCLVIHELHRFLHSYMLPIFKGASISFSGIQGAPVKYPNMYSYTY